MAKISNKKESIADLNYALGYLHQVQPGLDNTVVLERAKGLIRRVLHRMAGPDLNAGKHVGRTYTDTRKAAVLATATDRSTYSGAILADMTRARLSDLYDKVVADHENWDGEEVSIDRILALMLGCGK